MWGHCCVLTSVVGWVLAFTCFGFSLCSVLPASPFIWNKTAQLSLEVTPPWSLAAVCPWGLAECLGSGKEGLHCLPRLIRQCAVGGGQGLALENVLTYSQLPPLLGRKQKLEGTAFKKGSRMGMERNWAWSLRLPLHQPLLPSCLCSWEKLSHLPPGLRRLVKAHLFYETPGTKHKPGT
ncbi:hypothetical protein Cadr_000004942 [Camelus dromedarius]|uniref:Uncharacterized protein n=1 Tax=Camelus dromedarius TaxID=9838 RepID=A0A5N4EF92_CAMDR|nr:hypothetical protein Cadr_000004942 [Camelus dromedarius]